MRFQSPTSWKKGEIIRREVKVGDLIKHIFGMPGPDVSTGIVTRIEGDTFDIFDLTFQMPVEGLTFEFEKGWLGHFWIVNDLNLDEVAFADKDGQHTYHELLEKYKNR